MIKNVNKKVLAYALMGSMVMSCDIGVINVLAQTPQVINEVKPIQIQKCGINVIHANTSNYQNWLEKDLTYLNNLIVKGVNEKDILVLKDEIAKLQKELDSKINMSDATKFKGITVHNYNNVGEINVLTNALNMRYEIIKGKETTYNSKKAKMGYKDYNVRGTLNLDFNNPLASSQEIKKDYIVELVYSDMDDIDGIPNTSQLNMLHESIMKTLTDFNLPTKLTENINLYISPYFLDGYKGFTTTYHHKGREEEIIIALSSFGNSYETVRDTVLHEFGHVVMSDYFGLNSGTYKLQPELVYNLELWGKLESMFTDEEVGDLSGESRLGYMKESFAEHFRLYMLGTTTDSNMEYPVHKPMLDLIDSLMKGYDCETYIATPNIVINGSKVLSREFNSKHYESYKINNNGKSVIEFEVPYNDSKIDYMYSLYKRSENNEAIPIFKDIKITEPSTRLDLNLSAGEYAMTIHSDLAVYNFIDFYIIE